MIWTRRFKLTRGGWRPARMAAVVSASLALTLHALSSWAGRPLVTDDAGTAEARSCFVEGWFTRAGSDRGTTLAPACGVAEGLELGADYTLPSPRDVARGAAGAAVKWAPATWRLDTAAGTLGFGLKATTAFQRVAGSGWGRVGESVLALASWETGEGWTLHGNLGLQRDRASSTRATLYSLAVAWEPTDHTLVFAESLGNNRRATFGGMVRGIGGRYWVQKERLGVDLTASREAGAAPTTWTFGVGWYGLGF